MGLFAVKAFWGQPFFNSKPSLLTFAVVPQRDVELLTFWAVVANPTQAFYNLIQVPVIKQYVSQVQVEVSLCCSMQ